MQKKLQPRTQAITFAHPLLRKYRGAGWSRGSQDIELPREERTNLNYNASTFQ
jgi:hypothetical protein